MRTETSRTLDRMAAAEQARGRAPSLLLAVGRHGDVVHPASPPDTQYRIGSITKTFTATLVLQLRDEGRLALADPLERHLPGTPAGPVTIRQLLSHTAGLQADPDGPWWERVPGGDVARLVSGLHAGKLALPPGRWRHYSNLGFALLGAMAERLAGAPWWDAVRERILEPAGLRRTTYHPAEPFAQGYLVHPWLDVARAEPAPDTGAMAPAGQLWSTLADLTRWASVLSRGHDGVLAAATAEEMRAPVAFADPEAWTRASGLGVQLDRHGERILCGHTGSMPGHLSCVAVHPGSGWSAVAFANCYTGAAVTTLAHEALAAVLDAEPDDPVPWRAAEPPPPALQPLLGRWWWMGEEATVGFADGRLVVRQNGEDLPFVPEGVDAWRCVGGSQRGEVLRVLRDPSGDVRGLDIHTFVYLREPWPANPP